MSRLRATAGTLAITLCAGCHRPDPSLCDSLAGDPLAGDQRNVLVIVSDDIGTDQTGVYGRRDTPGHTPTIDALAAEGIRFTNAWASPTCSPTRASLLTGQHPSRTGIGTWIYAETDEAHLELSAVTLPEILAEGPFAWTSAIAGKWHLVTFTRESPATHPLDQGFTCHAGSLANPLEAIQAGNTPRGYENWEKSVDGVVEWKTRYMTTDTIDEALGRLDTLPSPWFLLVAPNGAHDPLHVPPASLTTSKVTEKSSDKALYDAMVESVDTEIGRLLDGLGDRRDDTTIVYLSDNGTPEHGQEEGVGGGKGTVYQGGVNIPMIITGPLVASPGVSDALVHIVDLVPTVAEIARLDPATVVDDAGAPIPLDGVSLLPLLANPGAPSPREYLYTEAFGPNGAGLRDWHDRAVRDDSWKLIREETGPEVVEQFFRMDAWEEGQDLLLGALTTEEASALERLRGAMDGFIAELPVGG